MQRRDGQFNPKRRIREAADPVYLSALVGKISYGGNPEHKRNPGDFGLNPPAYPRPGKTLCDAANILSQRKAIQLLRTGVKKGLISEAESNEFPQNIWSVAAGDIPMEAQLENQELGTYHGYPMPENDPLFCKVLEIWKSL